MQPKYNYVVADASCFILLDKINMFRLNFAFTGTLGIFLKAKQTGIIPKLRPVFEKIQATNFRIAPKLYTALLKDVSEWIDM